MILTISLVVNGILVYLLKHKIFLTREQAITIEDAKDEIELLNDAYKKLVKEKQEVENRLYERNDRIQATAEEIKEVEKNIKADKTLDADINHLIGELDSRD